jgi:hypothetical protein
MKLYWQLRTSKRITLLPMQMFFPWSLARAKQQKRPIYAIPGSSGSDALLKEGARQILTDMINFENLAEEILESPVYHTRPTPKQRRLF